MSFTTKQTSNATCDLLNRAALLARLGSPRWRDVVRVALEITNDTGEASYREGLALVGLQPEQTAAAAAAILAGKHPYGSLTHQIETVILTEIPEERQIDALRYFGFAPKPAG